jgi:hypothetical protein
MLGLYLLATHLVGDFLLQNRFQASQKAGWTLEAVGCRLGHVLIYSLLFVPLAVVYSSGVAGACAFLTLLFASHFLTDAQRFRSTLLDVVSWRLGTDEAARRSLWRLRTEDSGSPVTEMPRSLFWPTPNEWPAMPILIDQTLHVVQLAVLGGLFLS